MQAPQPAGAAYLVQAGHPSDSERLSGQLIAQNVQAATGRKPNARWVVLLRDPSGSRGGGGGATSDIAVFDSNPGDDNAVQVASFDVYTPERKTKTEGMQKYIRGKLSSQGVTRVCIDVCNFGQDALKQAQEMLGWKEFKGKVVLVNSKTQTFIG